MSLFFKDAKASMIWTINLFLNKKNYLQCTLLVIASLTYSVFLTLNYETLAPMTLLLQQSPLTHFLLCPFRTMEYISDIRKNLSLTLKMAFYYSNTMFLCILHIHSIVRKQFESKTIQCRLLIYILSIQCQTLFVYAHTCLFACLP